MSVCHTPLVRSLSVCQSRQTCPYVCQSRQSSDHHTVDATGPSICQPHDTSDRHTMSMTSPSVCPSKHSSDRHTTSMTSPSVCPSKQPSDRHTTSNASPSVCQSYIPSVSHTIMSTTGSPSVSPLHDSSVSQPPVWLTVCSSSVTSVLPSANHTVKIPTSIPVRNFPHEQNPGILPFVRTSTESSVHHPDSPSVNSSPFAANTSKLPGNYGENSTVNYLHQSPETSPPVSASYGPFVHASYV